MYYSSRIFFYLCTRIKELFSMDKMKVISIRMTDEELKDIDLALMPHPYYKRSDFIRAAVKILLNANLLEGSDNPVAANRTAIYDALRTPFWNNDEVKVCLNIEHYDKRAERNPK